MLVMVVVVAMVIAVVMVVVMTNTYQSLALPSTLQTLDILSSHYYSSLTNAKSKS